MTDQEGILGLMYLNTAKNLQEDEYFAIKPLSW